VAMVSLEHRFRSVLDSRSRINIMGTRIRLLLCMVMGRVTRDRFSRHSIWRSCGTCRFCLGVRVCLIFFLPPSHSLLDLLMLTNIDNKYGMGTAANRSSALTDYYKRGQYIPGLKVNGMDVLAVKAAVAYGKAHTVAGNGPLVLEYVTYRYGGHSMSDPGTTYRTREEIQRMRSTQDPIAGLKQKILEWGVTNEEELKGIDKEARNAVDAEVAEAEKMDFPEATGKVLYEDIYVRGSEPQFMRGRTPDENYYY